jgi:hypothetical protein
MKKILLGAVAAATVAAPAYADTTGHVDFSYQTANLEYDSGNDYDIDGWRLGGAVITPLSGAWSLQLDAAHNSSTWDDSDYDYSFSSTTAHAIYNGGSWRVGGFAGFGEVYGQTLYTIGGEGQWNASNFSIDGQLAYGSTSDGYDYDVTDVRVGGDYFFSPNLALNGSISSTEIGYSSGETQIVGVGFGLAYRLADSPISFEGGYRFEDWDYNGGGEGEANIFRVGVSFDFGTGSLQERVQEGASFNDANALTEIFSRWD